MWALTKCSSVTSWNAVKVKVFTRLICCDASEHSDSRNSGWRQRPLSWGRGKHPNHNTAPEGVGLTSILGKFSLSGLLSFLQRGLWSDFIPLRTTDTQRKHKIPINKALTFIFIFSANNYITFAAKFVQTNKVLIKLSNRDDQNAGSLLCVRLIPIPVTLRRWEGEYSRQLHRQLDRWRARLLPLVWRIIPYPLFVTRADKSWEKGLRGPLTHTHMHI